MNVMIACTSSGAPARLACDELRNYLHQMDPHADISILLNQVYDASRPDTVWVGLMDEFKSLLPEVDNPELDDGVYISVSGGRGVVTGTNERSVLLAAYRLLRENGCAFLHPGKNGERVPQKPLSELSAQISEAASSRHRGVCIEGAVGYEHVLNMITFLPKIGMNAYFFQFFTPGTFFDRWYSHLNNPGYEPRTLSDTEISGMRDSLVTEVKKRGLMYHAVGHGWTCEPFGLPGTGWDITADEDIPDSLRPYLAEMNGKRTLYGGIALNTNLCFGNPEVRSAVTSSIADYCEKHPEIDYLHFWQGDGINNHCECPLCRDTVPSDFYVTMLNQLDEKLTERNIPTRIVFLIYVDLLWEPQTERINHPDRFVMMFAPITRTYSSPFLPDAPFDGELAPYRRNQNRMPYSVAENLERLKRWQAQFSGDSFDFDYHFMWDHFRDMGYYSMARLLMTDMKNLSKIGLNGMISCQNQRVFFPTGLGMHAMAAGLWNKDADFDALAKDFYAQAFGEDGPDVCAYLSGISRLIDPVYLRAEKPKVDPAQAESFRGLIGLIDRFLPVITDRVASVTDPCTQTGWRMLLMHAELTRRLARMLSLRASGDEAGMRAAWDETAAYAQEIEPETHELFDAFEFQYTYFRWTVQL